MSKPVTMTDLLVALGNDNIGFQNLDQSLTKADWSAKSGVAKITFETEQPLSPEGPEKLGLVLWLDRSLVSETMARLKRGEGAANTPTDAKPTGEVAAERCTRSGRPNQ